MLVQSRTHRAYNNVRMSDLTIDMFEHLESTMWNALVDGDGASADRLLSSDYLGVYTTGFSDRDEYIRALANGPVVASFDISESRLLVVADDSILYSYRADFRTAAGGPVEVMFISSLWCEREGTWVNVFSQDTPGAERAPIMNKTV